MNTRTRGSRFVPTERDFEGPPRDLLLIGAGGFARETANVFGALNETQARWRLRGFLDDDSSRHGRSIDGLPVLTGIREGVDQFPGAGVVVCVGRPANYSTRAQIVHRLGLPSTRFATLIHPTAVVPDSCTIGPGSVLHPQVVLTASVHVGSHVALSSHVVLSHDAVVEDFVTFAAGARIAGSVRVGTGAYIGSGVLVREGCTIGAGALVGLGSVVLRDIPPGQVWVGNPARYLRDAPTPARS